MQFQEVISLQLGNDGGLFMRIEDGLSMKTLYDNGGRAGALNPFVSNLSPGQELLVNQTLLSHPP